MADARIVVNRGMFGVHLGATMNQVRQTLGMPSEILPGSAKTTWLYASQNLALTFYGKHQLVGVLWTDDSAERTASGVGVGSSQRALMRLVPGVRCGSGECIVVSRRNGQVYWTDFSVGANRRVDSVMIINQTMVGRWGF